MVNVTTLTLASAPQFRLFIFTIFNYSSIEKQSSWTIIGLRNRVVKDIRKMIGKIIWDAREDAEYELNCNTLCQCPFCVAEESHSSEQSSGEEDDENFYSG